MHLADVCLPTNSLSSRTAISNTSGLRSAVTVLLSIALEYSLSSDEYSMKCSDIASSIHLLLRLLIISRRHAWKTKCNGRLRCQLLRNFYSQICRFMSVEFWYISFGLWLVFLNVHELSTCRKIWLTARWIYSSYAIPPILSNYMHYCLQTQKFCRHMNVTTIFASLTPYVVPIVICRTTPRFGAHRAHLISKLSKQRSFAYAPNNISSEKIALFMEYSSKHCSRSS